MRWCSTLTVEVTGDPLWRMAVYRLSLFLMDLAWRDATVLDHGITSAVATQLYRAVTSISANIAAGYGRQSGRDRARFYEYALGSTREALVWYRAASGKLGEALVQHRIAILIELRQLLLVIAPAQRLNRGGQRS
jgi:four helix bundle protein